MPNKIIFVSYIIIVITHTRFGRWKKATGTALEIRYRHFESV